MKKPPDWMTNPISEFYDSFITAVASGAEIFANSKIFFAGLARNCAGPLSENLRLIKETAQNCKSWNLHIEENDSTDSTKSVLRSFVEENSLHATASIKDVGRIHRGGELAGKRTEELAEYRAACQRECAKYDSDYTVLIDWDQWGGWHPGGFATGFHWLNEIDDAFAMASISLIEHAGVTFMDESGKIQTAPQWVQYDAWALRVGSYWDDYGKGVGSWKHTWLPPIGTMPIKTYSAFGGLSIYRTEDFLKGTYSGEDCEHVPFHRSITEKTGKWIYLNPSQRCIMHWLEDGDKNVEPS